MKEPKRSTNSSWETDGINEYVQMNTNEYTSRKALILTLIYHWPILTLCHQWSLVFSCVYFSGSKTEKTSACKALFADPDFAIEESFNKSALFRVLRLECCYMLLLSCRTLEKEQHRCSADCNVFLFSPHFHSISQCFANLPPWQASAAAAAALAARTKKKRTAKAWLPKILAEALHQHRCHRCIPGCHIHRIVRARWLGKCTLCLTRCRRINT